MINFYRSNRILINSIVIFLLTLLVYLLSNNKRFDNYNYFVLLAEAFLKGQYYLTQNPAWLNELVEVQGKFYVVYPPMPAIVLMPAVAIFGTSFNQAFLSIFFGALNAALCYLVILKGFKNHLVAFWVALLLAFGTIQWYHAETGSAWYVAHILAMFFMWLMLLEALTKKRLFLIGLFLGAAYLSRLPTVLTGIFILLFLHEEFFPRNNGKIDVNLKSFFLFGLGVMPALMFNFSYNYIRYGTVEDLGYKLLPVFNEPWYQYGLFNVKYIPIHLREMFTSLPKFRDTFPYIVPSVYAMAVWFTTPALALVLFAKYKTKLVLASLVTILVAALPSLMHGGNGFTQFGYRHTLDYYPFVVLLMASGIRNNLNWWKYVLILLSFAVNLWGVIMLSFLEIWTW